GIWDKGKHNSSNGVSSHVPSCTAILRWRAIDCSKRLGPPSARCCDAAVTHPGAVRSPWSIDQDGVPEVTVMVGAVFRIGKRGQAGNVLREICRRAGLGGIERPRDIPRSVWIPGPRKVRPERHELVRERDLWPTDLGGIPRILRRVVDAQCAPVPARKQELNV